MNIIPQIALLSAIAYLGCGSPSYASDGLELPTGTCGYNIIVRESQFLVFFDSNSVSFSSRTKIIMDELMHLYRQLGKDGSVVIEGNIDAAELNDAPSLDLKRAEAVREYLISQGLPTNSISIGENGATTPFVPTDAGVSEPQNRYVRIFPRFGLSISSGMIKECAHWIRSSCMSSNSLGSLQACERAWDYISSY